VAAYYDEWGNFDEDKRPSIRLRFPAAMLVKIDKIVESRYDRRRRTRDAVPAAEEIYITPT
jgi:hypothetical protein